MADYVGSEVADVLLTVQGLLTKIKAAKTYIKQVRSYDAHAAVLTQSISDDVDTLAKQA